MTEEYEVRPEEDKFLLECAPNLGYFFSDEKLIFIINETTQLDLETMEMINVEGCILVEDGQIGAVQSAIRCIYII